MYYFDSMCRNQAMLSIHTLSKSFLWINHLITWVVLIEDVCIGRMPIMLGSSNCYLAGKTNEELGKVSAQLTQEDTSLFEEKVDLGATITRTFKQIIPLFYEQFISIVSCKDADILRWRKVMWLLITSTRMEQTRPTAEEIQGWNLQIGKSS